MDHLTTAQIVNLIDEILQDLDHLRSLIEEV